MSASKSAKIKLAIAIAIIIVSVAFLIVNIFVFPDFLVHPVLNSVALLSLCFSIMAYWVAAKNKAPVYFMVGGFLFGLVVLYVLLATLLQYWYIAVICTVAVWAVTMLISYITVGNKTEDIALNKSPEYKDYKERMQEKYAQAEAEESKELPKIKSFKDE